MHLPKRAPVVNGPVASNNAEAEVIQIFNNLFYSARPLIKLTKRHFMVTQTISNILLDLSTLLSGDLTPRSITFMFDKIASQISRENLLFEKVACREYYDDGDLALILLMKNEAIANAQFEQASKFRVLENELRAEKGDSERTSLKTENCFFEFRNNCIIFHCNKHEEKQRLIANLIEGYNLVHKRSATNRLLYCS